MLVHQTFSVNLFKNSLKLSACESLISPKLCRQMNLRNTPFACDKNYLVKLGNGCPSGYLRVQMHLFPEPVEIGRHVVSGDVQRRLRFVLEDLRRPFTPEKKKKEYSSQHILLSGHNMRHGVMRPARTKGRAWVRFPLQATLE